MSDMRIGVIGQLENPPLLSLVYVVHRTEFPPISERVGEHLIGIPLVDLDRPDQYAVMFVTGMEALSQRFEAASRGPVEHRPTCWQCRADITVRTKRGANMGDIFGDIFVKVGAASMMLDPRVPDILAAAKVGPISLPVGHLSALCVDCAGDTPDTALVAFSACLERWRTAAAKGGVEANPVSFITPTLSGRA
jgi:hypothetical protein